MPCARELQITCSEREAVTGSFATRAFLPLRDEDVIAKREKLLEQGVGKWRIVWGRYAREVGTQAPDEDGLLACLGTRSVHTILKRANAVLSFLRWFDVLMEPCVSPFEEESFWKFMKFLSKSKGAASSGVSFLAGMRFAKHVLGMHSVADPSRRCVGSSEKLASTAEVVRQAEALSVAQILGFHEILHQAGAFLWDRVFAAYCLLCVYGRCRQSDVSFIDHVEWDVVESPVPKGYIILYTRHHKTARATAKKALLLPIITPTESVDSRPWLPVARELFREVGLCLEGDIQGPLLRPLTPDGLSLCKRGISSNEVSRFMRLMLGLPLDASEQCPRVSSHSLKRTCLAFASKAGLSRFSRACLGRHVLATESSEALYSVDLGLPAVQELDEVLGYIRSGCFVPDAPRALRWQWEFPPEPPASSENDDAAIVNLDPANSLHEPKEEQVDPRWNVVRTRMKKEILQMRKVGPQAHLQAPAARHPPAPRNQIGSGPR